MHLEGSACSSDFIYKGSLRLCGVRRGSLNFNASFLLFQTENIVERNSSTLMKWLARSLSPLGLGPAILHSVAELICALLKRCLRVYEQFELDVRLQLRLHFSQLQECLVLLQLSTPSCQLQRVEIYGWVKRLVMCWVIAISHLYLFY